MRASRLNSRSELTFAVVGAFMFSSIINALAFTAPLFMIEVYDRVIPSQSLPTLIALLILAAGLYAFSGILDVLRSRVLMRLGAMLDQALSRRVISVIAGASLRTKANGDVLKPAQDLDQIRGFLSGSGPSALFDLPWMPVYLAVCFFLHPLIGWLTAAAMAVLVAMTIATDALTRARTREAADAMAVRNRFGEASHRNAEAIAAMGMLESVRTRFAAMHSAATLLQRRTGDVAGLFTGLSKAIRQAVQSGSLALGAYLVIEGDLTGGMIVASSVIVTGALQPVEHRER